MSKTFLINFLAISGNLEQLWCFPQNTVPIPTFQYSQMITLYISVTPNTAHTCRVFSFETRNKELFSSRLADFFRLAVSIRTELQHTACFSEP